MPPTTDPTIQAYVTLLQLGLAGAIIVLLLIGKLRTEREVTREATATAREKEIGDSYKKLAEEGTRALDRLTDAVLKDASD